MKIEVNVIHNFNRTHVNNNPVEQGFVTNTVIGLELRNLAIIIILADGEGNLNPSIET